MYDEAYGDVEEAEEDDVAILAGAAGEEAAPVVAEGEGLAQKLEAAGAGWEATSWVCCFVGVGHRVSSIRWADAGEWGRIKLQADNS
jgi:hypothetical protein